MIFPLSFIHAPCSLSYSRWDVGAQSQSQEIPQGNFLLFLFFSFFFSLVIVQKPKQKLSFKSVRKKKKSVPKQIYSISGEKEQDDTIPLNLCADFKEEPPWTGTQMYSVKAVRSSFAKIERKKSKRERGERWRQKAVHLADGQLLLRQLPAAFLQSAFDSQG